MEITLQRITVRELADQFTESADSGVVGYGGRLNIRPPYQREFVYDDKKRDAVITTILRGFPLNVMYWSDNGDGTYEVIDGQQRTISICRYVCKKFSYEMRQFNNQPADIQQRILDYELMIYVCRGSESEKLNWFEIINIAGEQLTRQELLNATYTGQWLADAKRYFSKPNCAAHNMAKQYLTGSAIRQSYLETALKWMSRHDNNGKVCIEGYMDAHRHDSNANALWMYFKSVIEWVAITFPKYRREMQGLDWGLLYDTYHEQVLDVAAIEKEISELMQDGDIQNKKGIYLYVLDHKEQHLDLRTFDEKTRRKVYEQQRGICPICGKVFDYEFMEADHIIPWAKGGRTTLDNCQMLCMECNRRKSGK